MKKRHKPDFDAICALLRGGAYIRYGIGPQMLICHDNSTGAWRKNIEEHDVSELYARKLIVRDPRSVTIDQTPTDWPWERRVGTVQKYTRYVLKTV